MYSQSYEVLLTLSAADETYLLGIFSLNILAILSLEQAPLKKRQKYILCLSIGRWNLQLVPWLQLPQRRGDHLLHLPGLLRIFCTQEARGSNTPDNQRVFHKWPSTCLLNLNKTCEQIQQRCLSLPVRIPPRIENMGYRSFAFPPESNRLII